MRSDPVSAYACCNCMSPLDICGIAVTAASVAAQLGYHLFNYRVCGRHGQEYSLWSWGEFLAVLDAIQ